MAQRYFLQCNYKGTRYHGWQVQPNAVSVQAVIEKALSTILRENIVVVGAGRTDTGVHASYYILHFDVDKPLPEKLDLSYKLNSFLPEDIAVQKVWPVNSEAHARYSAISRTYHYFITTEKDPFSIETSYRYTRTLDMNKMNAAAQTLYEYRDFTSFSKLHTDTKTNNCTIYQAEWKREGSQLIFVIKANRFLRNMVRAIVGTLMKVGKRKLSIEDFRLIIENQDRRGAGASAPAQGLFLVDIEYPDWIYPKP